MAQGFRCPECGLSFKSGQALGSHMRFIHKDKIVSPASKEPLDLKQDFMELLLDLGHKRAAKTITDAFFDGGADSLQNLDGILRLAGITNPSKALILKRWAQKVNSKVPEELLREKEPEKRTNDVWATYDKFRENELTELLMEDLRTRIKERRAHQSSGENEIKTLLDKLGKLEYELENLKSMQTERENDVRQVHSPPDLSPQRKSWDAYYCNNPHHPLSCVVCGTCGHHGSVRNILIGEEFVCPKCGAIYFRDR